MFKNLTVDGLGHMGRQNELIELGLTYGFDGIEIDIDDMFGRAETLGKQFACQFIKSASVKVGSFSLPIDLSLNDEEYQKQAAKIETIIDLASEVDAVCCNVFIEPASNDSVYHENFEKHRERICALADSLGKAGINIALGLKPATEKHKEMENQFLQKPDELLTLTKTVSKDNVGVFVDLWQWTVTGGTLDQIQSLTSNQVTNVQLTDVAEGQDLSTATSEHKVLPGDNSNSIAVDVLKHLAAINYDGPVSVSAAGSQFNEDKLDKIVDVINQRFERMLIQSGIKEGELIEETTTEGNDDTEEPVAATTAE